MPKENVGIQPLLEPGAEIINQLYSLPAGTRIWQEKKFFLTESVLKGDTLTAYKILKLRKNKYVQNTKHDGKREWKVFQGTSIEWEDKDGHLHVESIHQGETIFSYDPGHEVKTASHDRTP